MPQVSRLASLLVLLVAKSLAESAYAISVLPRSILCGLPVRSSKTHLKMAPGKAAGWLLWACEGLVAGLVVVVVKGPAVVRGLQALLAGRRELHTRTSLSAATADLLSAPTASASSFSPSTQSDSAWEESLEALGEEATGPGLRFKGAVSVRRVPLFKWKPWKARRSGSKSEGEQKSSRNMAPRSFIALHGGFLLDNRPKSKSKRPKTRESRGRSKFRSRKASASYTWVFPNTPIAEAVADDPTQSSSDDSDSAIISDTPDSFCHGVQPPASPCSSSD